MQRISAADLVNFLLISKQIRDRVKNRREHMNREGKIIKMKLVIKDGFRCFMNYMLYREIYASSLRERSHC